MVEYPDKEFYDDEIKQLGGRIYYTTVRNDLNIVKFINRVKTILKTHPEYKIVHMHTYSIGFFCLKAAEKCGVPVRIAHSHSNETVHDVKWILKLLMQKLYTLHATDLFACSDEAGKYLFKNKSFTVLQNAIDSKKFIANNTIRKEVRTEIGVTDNFVVGHVGRLHASKNHKFLIEVFKEIKNKENKAKLLLVGSGPLEIEIRQQIQEMGLKDEVIFLGNRKDMDRIYQAMDVFVFPSLFEGLGIVAIEAQAAGIPVICSEGLPPDAEVSPLYKKLYLADSKEKWAEEAIEIAKHPLCHTNMQQYIIDAGYDMSSTALEMQNYYLQKVNEVL